MQELQLSSDPETRFFLSQPQHPFKNVYVKFQKYLAVGLAPIAPDLALRVANSMEDHYLFERLLAYADVLRNSDLISIQFY